MDPLGELVGSIALYGTLGLFAVGLAERFLPVLPSYGLLLAVGAAAAENRWMPGMAALATASGSVLGCAVWFYAVRLLGDRRAGQFVHRAGWLFGMRAESVEQRLHSIRRNSSALAFALQLIPTTRFLAPALAALVQMRPRSFLLASAAGIAVWNSLFIAIGYGAALTKSGINATILGMAALSALLLVQAVTFLTARFLRLRRAAHAQRGGVF
jgi:membrane protein DedA with SNARE-associated domain